MKKILILLCVSYFTLEAFDSLINLDKLDGTKIEIQREKEPNNSIYENTKEKQDLGSSLNSKIKVSKNKSTSAITKLNAFISPTELKRIINDNNTIIFDVDKKSIYNKGHIETAIHVDVLSFINKEQNPYRLMKSDNTITNKIIDLGINKNSKVIIYAHNTKNGNLYSSYLALILTTFGFENISLLDGGYMAWVFENERLVSSISSNVKEDGNFIPNKNNNIIINKDYLTTNISNVTLIDARASDLYYGTKKTKKVKKFGHISRAKSSYYGNKFLLNGNLREKNELNDIYISGLDLKKDTPIIVYANNVFEASMEWYMLYKVMNFKDVKLYEASLMEYFSTDTAQIIRFKWE